MLQIDITPEREAQISACLEKWQQTLSTPIDRDKAIATLTDLYQMAGYVAPEVVFVDSPLALSHLNRLGSPYDLQKQLDSLNDILLDQLVKKLYIPGGRHWLSIVPPCISFVKYFSSRLVSRWYTEDQTYAHEEFGDPYPEGGGGYYYVEQTPLEKLQSIISSSFTGTCHNSTSHAAMYDSAAAMGVEFEPESFQIFLNAAMYLGHLVPYQEICFVSDRPQIKFDRQGRLHAEGEPCIVFPDGFVGGYFYHGTRLPDRVHGRSASYMGEVHPRQWKAEWVLKERNAELRRILIQEIGYARLCQELQAEELDSWREYTLLRLPVYDDFTTSVQTRVPSTEETDAMYLLKMTCPSTNFVHILRVPPSMQSAREAATWVNWGSDPEWFAVET
ncbi:MAG: hypothetical protein HXY43_24800 [Fischerella sp.]|jgi:hypothetical protein|uniref:DUF6745 domain-containing protein n=1 Tax=Fischerella sp. TaxID=1191 RepID=UPI0017DA19FC|nr:hypothetical protein [Fischerella sp.]NWF62375.1 hypothetical protein [Fischerella sp.]